MTKITVLNARRERKVNIYRGNKQEKAGFLSHYIKLFIVNLYTKYERHVLHVYSCGDIFDEKYGEKEKRTKTWKNK